ncbi:MAG TPA: hypothetical protein VGX96_06540 [Candidatus Elarobacter sp.]|nr:hypothetical protein [Candidatus Elarobacter sp.]
MSWRSLAVPSILRIAEKVTVATPARSPGASGCENAISPRPGPAPDTDGIAMPFAGTTLTALTVSMDVVGSA